MIAKGLQPTAIDGLVLTAVHLRVSYAKKNHRRTFDLATQFREPSQ